MGRSRLLFHGLCVSGTLLLSVRKFIQELDDAHAQEVVPLFPPIVAQIVKNDVPAEPLNERVYFVLLASRISAKKVGILLTQTSKLFKKKAAIANATGVGSVSSSSA